MPGRIAAAFAGVLGLVATSCQDGAHAQDYPADVVKIVVPWGGGETADIIARLVADGLQGRLGGTFIIENRPGASSTLGGTYAARAEPDGYTLMLTTGTTVVINPILLPDIAYEAEDFVPVASLSSGAFVFVGNNDFPAKTLGELTALAQKEPGRITYATNGPGTTTALIGALMERGLGVDLRPVPYQGGGPAMSALLGGEVNTNIEAVTGAHENIRAGKYFPYAVAADRRHPLIPDVPTFAELGYPEVVANSWQGLYAPAGTPPEIVETLNAAVGEVLQQPEVVERLAALGQQASWRSVADTEAYFDGEVARWSAAIANMAKQ